MDIPTAVSLVLGVVSLLGATGSVSVLFYRVRQLELADEALGERLARQLERTDGVHDAMIEMKNDLKWIRGQLEDVKGL